MPNLPRRFPCGEYFPGEDPSRTDQNQSISNSIPPIFIPSRPIYEPPFYPPITPPPGNELWACVGESPGEPFTGRGGRRCLPCTGIRFNPAGIAIAVDSADRRCIHPTLAACVIVCRQRTPDRGPGDGDGGGGGGDPGEQPGSGGGPGGPAGGEQGQGGPTTPGGGQGGGQGQGGPVTPGPGYSKCVEREIKCPPPDPRRTYSQSEIDQFPVKQILRSIVRCTFEEAGLDLSSGYPFQPDGPYPQNGEANDFCLSVRITSTDFWRGCRNSEILNNCISEPSNGQGSVTVTRPGSQNQNGSIINPEAAAASIINLTPKKSVTSVSISTNNLNRFSSPSGSPSERIGLFDDTYNFFKTFPERETRLVPNNQYLNIFNTTITEEVDYFLHRNNTSAAWHEGIINSLTNDKLIVSLNSQLLTALNNLHGVGGEKINLNDILTSLKSHLVTGRVGEFDPNYYFYVYNTQRNDSIISIDALGETGQAILFSLAAFELSSTTPDYSQYTDLTVRNDYKRMRVLLEDINTNIPTLDVSGNSQSLFLRNSGIPTESLDGVSSFLDIGNGAGYYISALDVSDYEYPLITTNELSSSKYLPPYTRHLILRTLGTDPGLILHVSSDSNHEFSETYNPSADVSPMYFKLDFNNLDDVISPNSVVNILSATYTRVTDAEGAAHSRNYSFNIIKVNVDHRDPIIHYARDTSTMSVELDDFNLRAFDENRTPVRENIILRNVPAAIILTPGMGSNHNPFNNMSNIINYGDPVVVRSLNITPSMDVNNSNQLRPPLESSNVYNSIGTPYFGLYEKLFDQDIHSNIFTYDPNSPAFSKSYFYNGVYSNTQPPSSAREGSIESKLAIDIVDKLANLTGVEDLTYWDVYRRLSINDIGKLASVSAKNLIRKLESGWRNGIKIKYVLSRDPVRPSGIPDGTTIPNDQIIINEQDRTL